MLITFLFIVLIENAQHLVQAIVDLTMKQRNLHDDAAMYQTIYKWVRKAFRHLITIVIIRLMINVKNRHINVTNFMTKDINGNHRYSIWRPHLVVNHIFGIGILCTKILTETKRLRFKPRLLQFNKDKSYRTIILTDLCSEVNTEHRDIIPGSIGIFVSANFNRHDLLLQQCRKDGLCNTLILH